MRMPIDSGWLAFGPKIDDPQMSKNRFSPPSGGFHISQLVLPATIRKAPGAGCPAATR
jgi:hypothetical protein